LLQEMAGRPLVVYRYNMMAHIGVVSSFAVRMARPAWPGCYVPMNRVRGHSSSAIICIGCIQLCQQTVCCHEHRCTSECTTVLMRSGYQIASSLPGLAGKHLNKCPIMWHRSL